MKRKSPHRAFFMPKIKPSRQHKAKYAYIKNNTKKALKGLFYNA
ncbi:hypothetical protein PCIT_a3767 [Pseudoalteromonas citrea]|uniref:Uncharacterized protein n=1 Tax=Pseudoalteromonas citrea TaxID=43655 RepID=A0AAD4AG82_9GAMM|nr:hypothetical protein PCIT_a3767 [Pseudoalteromonas citrea]